jgi:hypothetical protein
MAKDLPKCMCKPVLFGEKMIKLPDVAEEFNKLLPNSTLYWIDKWACRNDGAS